MNGGMVYVCMLCGVVKYIISYNGFFVKRFFQKSFLGSQKSFLTRGQIRLWGLKRKTWRKTTSSLEKSAPYWLGTRLKGTPEQCFSYPVGQGIFCELLNALWDKKLRWKVIVLSCSSLLWKIHLGAFRIP